MFAALVAFELAVPWWAERKRPSAWHPHHIAERHGLFAIILFGEGVLAASIGVERALAAGGVSLSLRAFTWGYGHDGIFAALAALGAGLEVAVEQTGHHVAASPEVVGYAVAIPVAALLILLWALHAPICPQPVLKAATVFVSTAVILVLPLASAYIALGAVVVAIAAVCALLVALAIRPDVERCRSTSLDGDSNAVLPQRLQARRPVGR